MAGLLAFIFEQNLVQLAVAFVMGAAFGKVVSTFVSSFITPLLGIFGGKPVFNDLYFEINSSRFHYGEFVDALFTLIVTGIAVFYIFVLPSMWFQNKYTKAAEEEECPCTECLSTVKKAAKRCPYCTSNLLMNTSPQDKGKDHDPGETTQQTDTDEKSRGEIESLI